MSVNEKAPEALPEVATLLVEQCPDGVIFSGPEGTIRVWNEAAEHIFGFSAAQAVGENLDIIIPERLRKPHWRGFDEALANGRTKHSGAALPTKAICADGTTIYVELSFAVILNEEGKAIGALAQARDINERFQKERDDRKRLRELEKKLGEQH